MKKIYKTIAENYGKLSENEQEVIDFILKYQPVDKLKMKDISNSLFLSNTTIIRACKKLGFSTFNELKYSFVMNDSTKESSVYVKSDFDVVIKSIRNDMNTTLDLLDEALLNEVADILVSSRRIFCIGAGSSSQVASDFNYKLKLSNIWSNEYLERYAIKRIPTIIEEADCLVVFSLSGNISGIYEDVLKVKNKNVKIIAITSIAANQLNRISDFTLSFYKSPSQRKKIQSRLMLNLVSNILYEQISSKIPYVE